MTLLELQFITILVGIVATFLPALCAVYFIRDIRGFGGRLALMLFGETVSMGAALYFAVVRYWGWNERLDPTEIMVIQWVMFTTAFLSTWFLVRYVVKINKNVSRRRRKGDV